MFIVKRKDIPKMEQVPKEDSPKDGTDKREKILRFKVLSGSGGFYIYDYRKFTVAKKEDKFLSSTDPREIRQILDRLPQEVLTHQVKKGQSVDVWLPC
jgi:hypothetical protein